MTAGRVEYLDLDDVLDLGRRLLGDPVPVRDMGLLGSAVARPRTTVFGHDAYPDIWTKAAALLQSVVNYPALIDGNKRLGWLPQLYSWSSMMRPLHMRQTTTCATS